LWVWHSSGLTIGEHESLIEVWAMLKTGNISSNFVEVLSIEFFIGKLVIAGAVISDLWVWDTFSLTVSESHSLVEVWAVRKTGVCSSPVWILLLSKLVITGAVIINLWVWNTSGLAVSKSESLVEVWAMWKTAVWGSPVWILLLSKLVIAGAVIVNLWVWNTFSLTVGEGHYDVEV